MRGILCLAVALALLFSESAAMAQAPTEHGQAGIPAYRALAEELMQLVDAGKADAAIDWVNAHNTDFAERDKAKPEWARDHRHHFQSVLGAPGSLQGHAIIAERVVGDRLAHIDYALWGANAPKVLGLTLYRRGDGYWTMISWSWGSSIEELLDPAWRSKKQTD